MTEAPKETKEEKKPEPGTGHLKHSFLVGELVYLRSVEEDDAEYGASWRQGMIPRSVSATSSWIEDDLKDEDDLHLIILRKSDDRPVGSLVRATWRHNAWITGTIDPLFGEQGQHWLAEAYTMMLHWSVDEHHRLIAHIEEVPDSQQIVLEKLQAMGARISSTFREAHRTATGDGADDARAAAAEGVHNPRAVPGLVG